MAKFHRILRKLKDSKIGRFLLRTSDCRVVTTFEDINFQDDLIDVIIVEEDRDNVVGKIGKNSITIYIPLVSINQGTSIVEVTIHELIHLQQVKRDGWVRFNRNLQDKNKVVDYELEAYTKAIVNLGQIDPIFDEVLECVSDVTCFSIEDLLELVPYTTDYAFILPKSMPNMSDKFYDRANFHLKNLYMTKYGGVTLKQKDLYHLAEVYADYIKKYRDVK